MKSFLLLWLGLLWGIVASAQPSAYQSAGDELDRIVAVVNDDVIVLSELEARMRTIRSQLVQSGVQPPQNSLLRRQVLEQMISDRLQIQIAERSGIQVDDEMVNRAVNAVAERNGLSLKEFRDVLERDGYSFRKFREDLRNEIMISQLQRREINDRIQITSREVDSFLATQSAHQGGEKKVYHIGQILIAVPEAATPEQLQTARARVKEVQDKLDRGADFAQIAAAMSDDRQALQGGDLGWRTESELSTPLAAIVTRLRPGEISEPLRSPSGFHILKLLAVRGEEQYMVVQSHVRHILVQANETLSEKEASQTLTKLRERILRGEDFASLASSYSEDRASAARGGDLGWVSPGDLVPRFEQEISRLAPGQISEPFQTQFGWHIAQLLERRRQDETEEVRRTKATQQIRQRKFDEELQKWLRELRAQAYVELRLEGLS